MMLSHVQVENMRLTNGLLFGLPIVFDTNDESIKAGDKILLKQVYTYNTLHPSYAFKSCMSVAMTIYCTLSVHIVARHVAPRSV
jgi:ATP sulfurylase